MQLEGSFIDRNCSLAFARIQLGTQVWLLHCISPDEKYFSDLINDDNKNETLCVKKF